MSTFLEVEKDLITTFPGTDAYVRMCSVSLVTHTHVFLHGPGGTAKTSLFREYAKALPWSTWFRQFNRETTLRDVFGSRDIPALMEGREAYLREGTLYHAELGIFDEVFNAPADALTSLNLALNERELEEPGNKQPTKLPLKVVWAAANKFPPISRPEVAAMYDRFLLRGNVLPVKDHAHRAQVLLTARALRCGTVRTKTLPAQLLAQAHQTASAAVLRPDIQTALFEAVDTLEREGIIISPRREAAMALAVVGHAVVRGRTTPGLADLSFAIQSAGWHELEHLPIVKKTAMGLGNEVDKLVQQCMQQAEASIADLREEAQRLRTLQLRPDHGRLRPIVERLADAHRTLRATTRRPLDEDEMVATEQHIETLKQEAAKIMSSMK